jgi:hypothetical protein
MQLNWREGISNVCLLPLLPGKHYMYSEMIYTDKNIINTCGYVLLKEGKYHVRDFKVCRNAAKR